MGKHTTDHDTLSCQDVAGGCLSFCQFHLQTVVAQALDDLLVLLVMEVGDDALCHHLADTFYLLQLFQSGIHQGIDVLEVSCQELGGSLTHETDAEGKHHALERHLFRGGDTVHNPLGRLRARDFVREPSPLICCTSMS